MKKETQKQKEERMKNLKKYSKNEKQYECDCCMWDDIGYTHEPYCSSIKKK